MSDYDVVIVGTGIAGLCAALEAESAGASVLLVEAMDVVGGSSRLAHGLIMGAGTRFQAEKGITDTGEALYRHYMTFNQWTLQQTVAKRLCYEAGPTIEWLADLGVQIVDVYPSGDELVPRGHVTLGGAAIIETVYSEVRKRTRIDIAFGKRMDRLLVEDGRVVGVAAGGETVHAGATILACGGLGASTAMLKEFCPVVLRAARDWLWYIGAPGSRGDAIRVTLPLGAQITGHDRAQLTMRPNFGRYTDTYFPGWLVIVNDQGRRFFDEMSPYSITQPIVLNQDGPVYAILDDAARQAAVPHSTKANKKVVLPGEEEEDWIQPKIDVMLDAGRAVRADTFEQLAFRIGVPAANLAETLSRYNDSVDAGEDRDYNKVAEYMRKVSQPPFYATELRLYMLGLTSVGPRIDADARVVDETSRPIPGLFAAGECVGGVIGKAYAGSGNSLANCSTFGRVAGRVAAAEVLGSRVVEGVS
jgi:succinate dehydrogenase/fumarate reductase flavoprotein subunit